VTGGIPAWLNAPATSAPSDWIAEAQDLSETKVPRLHTTERRQVRCLPNDSRDPWQNCKREPVHDSLGRARAPNRLWRPSCLILPFGGDGTHIRWRDGQRTGRCVPIVSHHDAAAR
jgi:hypothetical protein